MVELLLEAGIPGSVVQVVTGSGSVVGKELIASPKIDGLSLYWKYGGGDRRSPDCG